METQRIFKHNKSRLMKVIKFIVKIYKILIKIGTYIDFKKIADDFKGNKVEKRSNLHRPGNRRSDKKK